MRSPYAPTPTATQASDTALAHAFLRGLIRWAADNPHVAAQIVVIPTNDNRRLRHG
jgi:hypothetical protein